MAAESLTSQTRSSYFEDRGLEGARDFKTYEIKKRKLLKIDNNTLTDSKRQIETFSQGYWAPSNKPKNWTRHSAFNDSTKS